MIPQSRAEAARQRAYWDALYARGLHSLELTEQELVRFRQHVQPEGWMTAVDVGCGRGDLAAAMARMGMLVTGYDWSDVAVRTARAVHGQRRLRFQTHDLVADPSPQLLVPGGTDVVACRLALQYLGDPFLSHVRRWLRPDTGVLYLVLQVQEKQPPDGQERGFPNAAIEALRQGWRSAVRYDVDPAGAMTCLVLRGPLKHRAAA
ncbi:class I SAM-dependent methyltransferase [Streptomyces sp. NPDC059193]|uniref:class I SAM-dependent methyltransferase n=1 Tax=Streptomyces sp. NPDC059193 TaxID=3346763 RepID=UPI0036924713